MEFLKYWPVPNQHLRIPTREGETFVIGSGAEEGPPLLLLHGTAFNSAMWMGDIASWAMSFRVYAIDIIGDAGMSAPSRPSFASESHALWLEDVMRALRLESASFVGNSLGGWLALDLATRRPERVRSLVAIAPGGIASRNVLLWALPLLALGSWGRRKMTEIISGPAPLNPSPAQRAVAEFTSLIFRNMRTRTDKFPVFSDEALKRLTMPVMAILAGKDAFIDSPRVKARLERNVSDVRVLYLPDARHAITNQTAPILDFLRASRAS
jgi:pimeloyl-ACP methyl ester carboxylesterase